MGGAGPLGEPLRQVAFVLLSFVEKYRVFCALAQEQTLFYDVSSPGEETAGSVVPSPGFDFSANLSAESVCVLQCSLSPCMYS